MGGRTVLLVEGVDDEHVVKHICGAQGLGTIDNIVDCGGKDTLLEALPVRLKESDVYAIGIVIDADTDVQAKWDAISGRIRPFGYAAPIRPSPDGTIIAPPAGGYLPRVGVWIMPNNQFPGILEDFLAFLIPPGDDLFAHVKASIDAIPAGCCRFDRAKRPKAEIHTWLAWQSEPGKPLGVSITARYLDPHLREAHLFSQWLHRLFFS